MTASAYLKRLWFPSILLLGAIIFLFTRGRRAPNDHSGPDQHIRDAWNKTDASRLVPIPGSVSPDGKWHLVHFGYGPTTAHMCMVLSDSRQSFVGVVPVDSESDYRPGMPYHYGSTLLWSPDSRHVAIHDGKLKHSVVRIFRRDDAEVRELPVLGVRPAAGVAIKHAGQECLSSGQHLLKWNANDRLEVEVRMKFARETVTAPVIVQIHDDRAEAR